MKELKRRSFDQTGILIILLGLASVVLSQVAHLNHAFDYAASCTMDYQCDSGDFLICNMSTLRCDCNCSDGSLWNFEWKQCLRMEGWSCSTKHGENCTENSSCIAGKCVCDDDYLANSQGACQLTHNMPCGDDRDGPRSCSWLQYLQCPNSSSPHRRCKCYKEGNNFTWDENKKKCVGLVGNECDYDAVTNPWGIECVWDSHCDHENICRCNDGYSMTSEKTCMLKYGERCDNSQGRFCNKHDFLNCLDRKCNCEFYNQMKYDEGVGKCQLLSGEPCGWPVNGNKGRGNLTMDSAQFSRNGLDNRIHSCVPGAVCVARNEHGRGMCACVDGKREAKDKTCEDIPFIGPEDDFEVLKTSVTPCTDLPTRENSVTRGCFIVNVSKRLLCTNESGTPVCSCGEGAFFNGTDCINFPGENCISEERSNQCAKNSFCDVSSGVCKCFEHFHLETETFSCKPTYRKPSTLAVHEIYSENDNFTEGKITNGSCSSLNFHLDRMKCFCEMLEPFVTWTDAGELCIGIVGAPCKNSENFNFLCIENSHCDLVEGSCRCDEGYYQTAMDVCLLDDGMGMDYTNVDYWEQELKVPTGISLSSSSTSYYQYHILFLPFFLLVPIFSKLTLSQL